MIRIFAREMRANWKGLLFWALGLLALSAIGFVEYSGVAKADASINQIFDMMPRMVQVAFGLGMIPVNTPEGYYACMFVWLCFIAYTFAALLGAGILSKEERDKTAEFLFTRPITRSTAITGKAAAGLTNIVVLWVLGWVVTLAAYLPQLPDNSFAAEINKTMPGMLVTMVVYFFVGLACAALAKSNKQATQWAAGFVVVSYFVSVLIELVDAEYLSFLTPFRYFNAAKMLLDGVQPLYFALAAVWVGVAGWVTYHFYRKRDLRN